MDWIDLTTVEPMLQQTTAVTEAAQPTNPSSLTLAVIGLLTYLAFDITRRSISRSHGQSIAKSQSSTKGIRPRRAA